MVSYFFKSVKEYIFPFSNQFERSLLICPLFSANNINCNVKYYLSPVGSEFFIFVLLLLLHYSLHTNSFYGLLDQQEILDRKMFPRVKNSRSLHRTFNVEPLYLQHENTGLAIDYMVRETIYH